MPVTRLLAISAVSALVISTSTAQAQRYYHHHHGGGGAAVGAALGAGVFLGALAGAAATRDREVYVEGPPPPPPPAYGYDAGPEQPREAIAACRRGLLDAARRYGAVDAQIGDVYSVRETPNGHVVRAEITIDYPRDRRTSDVTCETEDGILVSARNEN